VRQTGGPSGVTPTLAADNQRSLEAQGSTVTAKYGYGNALYRKDGEFPLFDGLGSERTVTNGSQTVTGTINFDAFGQTVGSTGSSTNPYMFAATSGYRSDGDAGLMHVRARRGKAHRYPKPRLTLIVLCASRCRRRCRHPRRGSGR
jgi:hypothetical protein